MPMIGTRWKALLGALILAAGCGGDSPIDPTTPGSISGKVTAEDGTTPVPAAAVFIEANGPSGAGATTSDVNGNYTISQLQAGSYVVIATKGNFRSETPVTVQPGKTTNATVKLAPTGKLGVVLGSYDFIEDILAELGYKPDTIVDHANLENATALAQYKMIFLNCGAFVSTEAATALKAWVQAGGTLYASDWELDVVQAMFPSDILEWGYGDEQDITATVTNTDLQTFTGKSNAAIRYDLASWRMLTSISATPTILLRGTVTGYAGSTSETTFPNQPLAISIAHGTGRVVYTTFHNEAGVTADQRVVLRYFILF
jgi:hypothetical protein